MSRRYRSLVKTWVANHDSLIITTRRYIEDVLLLTFADSSDAKAYGEKLSTASCELLENAQKFSPEGSPILVEVRESDDHLWLRVTNRLIEDPSDVLGCVKEQVRSIWSEPDPREAFRRRVKASLADPEAKSMLGYAKIRMETGAKIRARLTAQNHLEVSLWFRRVPVARAFVDSP